jgi:hypothetical protein
MRLAAAAMVVLAVAGGAGAATLDFTGAYGNEAGCEAAQGGQGAS